LAKIAVELERAVARRLASGAAGQTSGRLLGAGAGWVVEDVLCTAGPQDRPFEEQHATFNIAVVAAGSFQYRSSAGNTLMTPGSLLLGNAGQCYECGHEHHAGDRCISFRFDPAYFQEIAGLPGTERTFNVPRVPPIRPLSSALARAFAGLTRGEVSWEELSLQLAAATLRLTRGMPAGHHAAPPSVVARVSQVVRRIEHESGAALTLRGLSREAGTSPYHFLRIFQQQTGVTPHQYLLRARLRAAALRLITEPVRIIDIAYDCGFGDLSNFNRAFRAEFGMSPRAYRASRA
jgi:AraC-like DNA-binding protein